MMQTTQHAHADGSQDIRIFLDELPWDIRLRNTDGRYVRDTLPKLAQFDRSLQFIAQRSNWLGLRENANVLRAALARRIGLPPSLRSELFGKLNASELAHSRAQLVFSHRAFPMNAGAVPVVWQQSILDPTMQRSYGASEAALNEEHTVKGELFHRAALVHVSTEAEALRLSATFPDIADRFVAVPFFTPHAQLCAPEQLERHRDASPVRVLFVGGQAWRKGLDLLLQAFISLPPSLQQQTELVVISSFDRSNIQVPLSDRIRVLRSADVDQVLAEMARSHIFVNVARFESYGLVFHEAMSQGLACLAPDWEVQREIFDEGRAGVLLPPDATCIRGALEELIVDEEQRYRLGVAAWNRYRDYYAPKVVAKGFSDIFRRAASRAHQASPSGLV